MGNRYAAALGRIGARVRMSALTPERRREVARKALTARLNGTLPDWLRPVFSADDFDELRLPGNNSIVIRAVLADGSPDNVAWLRRRLGDAEIRRWIARRRGRGLSVRQVLPWISSETARRWQAEGTLAE